MNGLKVKSNRYVTLALLLSVTAFAKTKINYKPSDEIFPNPERGFFSQFPRARSGSIANPQTQDEQNRRTLATLGAIKASGQTVVELEYNLSKFRDRKLSIAELNLIKNDFHLIREAGMKCQLRFAYSESIGEPDAPLRVILEHIAQLKPILRANYDVIVVMQAGFIGAWGEWHSSTNGLDNVSDRRKILFAELNALPKVRMVQVRTPHFKREIFNRETPISRREAFNETMYSRVGEHNDCFLANWNDYGTYTDTTEEEEYIAEDCKYVPMGGETCNPSSYSECRNAIYQMQKLHWSLLNSEWNPDVYRVWIADSCMNEVKRRLGYRFELISGSYDDSLKPGDEFNYSISLANVGFAALFSPRDIELIIENQSSKAKYFVRLSDNPRFWQPGDTVVLSGEVGLPKDLRIGMYNVYLNLPDPAPQLHYRSDYSIRFANGDVWDPESGYNNLNFTLAVHRGIGVSKHVWLRYFRSFKVPERISGINHRGKD